MLVHIPLPLKVLRYWLSSPLLALTKQFWLLFHVSLRKNDSSIQLHIYIWVDYCGIGLMTSYMNLCLCATIVVLLQFRDFTDDQ